jgi:hypothetical protein
MKDERILTLHPEGKKGVNISIKKYEMIKAFILDTIKRETEISYKDLNELAIKELSGKFDGSVSWYIVSVKLDLEARNMIERVPKTSPHKLRLKHDSYLK